MLDKILAFIAAFLKKTTTTTTLTPEVGTGSIYVMQVGKIVLVSALIETTTALATGDTLISGLPTSKVNNVNVTIANSNSIADRLHYTYVNNQNNVGFLRYVGTASEATRSFRISFAYIAS